MRKIIFLIIIFISCVFSINYFLNKKPNKSLKKENKKIVTKEVKKKRELYACIIPVFNENDEAELNTNNINNDNKIDENHVSNLENEIEVLSISNNIEESKVENIDDLDKKEEVIIKDNNKIDEEVENKDQEIEVSQEQENNSLKEDVNQEQENNSLKEDVNQEQENNSLKEDVNQEQENNTLKEDINIANDVISSKEDVLNDTVLKNGFINEDGKTYYYENNEKIKGLKVIDGVNNYFANNGVYLGKNNVKVIDVSHHQGIINWDLFAKEALVYGVIVRVGYWNTLDKQFINNINALKRLNIPYGIYLYSYATTINGAIIESNFVSNIIKKYDLTPVIGIYYDIESWKTKNSSSDNISKETYDNIVNNFVKIVNNNIENKYKVGVYSGRWYAMNRLGKISKSYVDWVAEYNKDCKYDSSYSMWQYTSKGRIPGINGNVDISYLK